MFLGIGQALVGLVRSAESVNSASRLLYIALIVIGLLGTEGTLGQTFQTIAKWSPVGALMNTFAGVLDTSNWGSDQTLSVVSCAGYLIAGAFIGIAWFRWNAR